jgi:hypothetical protein
VAADYNKKNNRNFFFNLSRFKIHYHYLTFLKFKEKKKEKQITNKNRR